MLHGPVNLPSADHAACRDFLPAVHMVADRYAAQRASGYLFAVMVSRIRHRQRLFPRLAAVILHPCPRDLAEDDIAVVVEQHHTKLLQAAQVARLSAVVEDFRTESAHIWLLARS